MHRNQSTNFVDGLLVPTSENIKSSHLERFATTLASEHKLSTQKGGKPFLVQRLKENVQIIQKAYDMVYEALMIRRRITSIDEWLIDNFYFIEEQERLAKKHLPKDYFKEMPLLESSTNFGLPRVYQVVLELIGLVDGQITIENLSQFIESYQSVSALKIGELWFVPIALRLGLIENIRRIAEGIIQRRSDCNTADHWADKLLVAADRDSKEVVQVMYSMSQQELSVSNAFVIQLINRLQGSNPLLNVVNTWLQQQLTTKGVDFDEIYRTQRHIVQKDQISLRNSIGSLRFVNIYNWKEFVESFSTIETILRNDPYGIYSHQEFHTRDRCRQQVEFMARRNKVSEESVAQFAVKMASEAQEEFKQLQKKDPNNKMALQLAERKCCVAYWLFELEGIIELQQKAGFRVPIRQQLTKIVKFKFATIAFLLSIIFQTALFMSVVYGGLFYILQGDGISWTDSSIFLLLAVLLIPLVIVGSQWAVQATNDFAIMLAGPAIMPRIDFSTGIPDEYRSMVVVPTMITSEKGINSLISDLQARYLVNRDRNLVFALITDFADAAHEKMPNDEKLINLAVEKIRNLNEMYKDEESCSNSKFYIFHRPRKYNTQEGCWMGWERKRGKLTEFNRFLLTGTNEGFSHVEGDVSILQTIKYIITLDTDTGLPPDCARELVGNAAHILNRPIVNPALGRVVKGYGVLQPRVSLSLLGAYNSLYSQMNSLDSGYDPYTRVVSDVYQDVFGEGSFIGKGLYNLETFEHVLEDKFPENRILSHDLIEGCFTRSGLVSDVEFIEEYPSSYWTEGSRRHRWVRGDWQIASWILPFVPSGKGMKRNTLSTLSKWKIFDNLRRSFVNAAMVLVFAVAWSLPSYKASVFLSAANLSIFFWPVIQGTFRQAIHKSSDISWEIHFHVLFVTLGWNLVNTFANVAFLPFEAFNNVDAAIRSLLRIYVTKKNLLQWTISTADASAYASSGSPLMRMIQRMISGPSIALALLITSLATRGLFLGQFTSFVGLVDLVSTVVLIALWIASPYIAFKVSEPRGNFESLSGSVHDLNEDQKKFLLILSRKIWRYFETFVREEDNWLPLDNFQEFPKPLFARRTSPTNIGFALLSNITAYDFGFISAGVAIDRVDKTFDTMSRMERYKGHFYNWYDTATLKPLPPRYVSSVDSGNLVGFLLILKTSLQELIHAPVLTQQTLKGLQVNLDCIQERLLHKEKEITENGDIDLSNVRTLVDHLSKMVSAVPTDNYKILDWIQKLKDASQDLITSLNIAVSQESNALDDEDVFMDDDILYGTENKVQMQLLYYATSFVNQMDSIVQELRELSPYIALANTFSGLNSVHDLKEEPMLHELMNKAKSLFSRSITLDQTVELADHFKFAAALEAAEKTSHLESATKEKLIKFIKELQATVKIASRNATNRVDRIIRLLDQCNEFIDQDFTFLYDRSRDLFTIGYNVDWRKLDNSYYDTLCSEARICSYVMISLGQFPTKNWFSMSRLLTRWKDYSALLSWSGSMFEYLMPLLIMPSFKGTLLEQTYFAVVNRHIEYGKQKKVPWGISESALNVMDGWFQYQYGPFGVPGLGLKRGLSDDLVIAPYASCMALMVMPKESTENLQRMTDMGFNGTYGMYEAIDFTPARLRGDTTFAPIRSFFAHHSGMSFLALAYTLLDKPMQKRFSNTPVLASNELLLQERVPRTPIVSKPNVKEVSRYQVAQYEMPAANRKFVGIENMYIAPEVHLLSNGKLNVMTSIHGGGYINFKDLSITRWHEDVTLDGYGVICYIRDMTTKKTWTSTSNPIPATPESNYAVLFSQGKAEYKRTEDGIQCHTTICVSPYDDVEVRRVSVSNRNSSEVRHLELTSYGEVVLGKSRADAAHRAFSTMFIKTEILKEYNAILCNRQPRMHNEKSFYAFHILLNHDASIAEGSMTYETDRYKFLGRCHGMQSPQCMTVDNLSNTEGFSLDPIVAIRQKFVLQPESTAHVDYITGVAETREQALAIIAKYQKKKRTDFVIDYSWISSQKLIFRLGISEIDAQMFSKLAACLLYSNPKYRAAPSLIQKNRFNQSRLWALGISGDIPIMLVRINDVSNITLLDQCLRAHTYFRSKGLFVDLVVWNDETSSYRNELQSTVLSLIASREETSNLLDKPGGIFPRRGENIHDEEATLLYAIARVILSDNNGSLIDQIEQKSASLPDIKVPMLQPTRKETHKFVTPVNIVKNLEQRNLVLTNEFGGFDKVNKEYVITLQPGKATPHPWCNVIANSHFGTVISEKGSAYSWYDNSHEYRLSPWNNDSVLDGSGEAFYIRDEETGQYWSPVPQPIKNDTAYICSHGMGYSTWENAYAGLHTTFTTFCPTEEPCKIMNIKITNHSAKKRNLSVTGFVEWTLAELRSLSYPNVTTDVEIGRSYTAVTARNYYNIDYTNAIGFFSVVGHQCTFTGNRSEFIGFRRTLGNAAAMERECLSNSIGAGYDPCAALNTKVTVEPGKSVEVAFILGAHHTREGVKNILERVHNNLIVRQLFNNMNTFWHNILDTIQVETPDHSVDVMANGWLLYQVLSSRIWGRSGFYQSSGAFGYRDQLQDAMSAVYSLPWILKRQILTCCEHQFEKGDVMHWWHPNSNRGVRTTFSDDYLWLPLAVAHYLECTGDWSIMDRETSWVVGPEVKPPQESHFDRPNVTPFADSVYEHCKRSLLYGFKYGEHGLCLMGCGDWNDGMNLVGINGKGESVWLSFFLIYVIDKFSKVIKERGDDEFLAECKKQKAQIIAAIETNGWDGEYYRRAFFDNGEPLGSKSNDECQIDALPQSWALITGAVDSKRAETAMEQAYKRLVRKDLQLVQLFDPPFEKSHLEPGYIKGYAPGIRENGGQYTHASCWLLMAYTYARNVDRAWEIFDIMNPIHHTRTPKELLQYRGEPYVIAADIYTLKGHEGQAGWTWYTGSAGWFYRTILERLIGLNRSGNALYFTPCPRPSWKQYKVHYKFGKAVYHICVSKKQEGSNITPSTPTLTSADKYPHKDYKVTQVLVEGEAQNDLMIHLVDEQKEFHVDVILE